MPVDEYSVEFTELYAAFKKIAGRIAVTGDEPLWAIYDHNIRKLFAYASEHPEILNIQLKADMAKPIFFEEPPK
jgi:hypothetical protein